MTLDPAGADVAVGACIVIAIAAVVHLVGGGRLGVLLGIRPGAPLLLNPTGARLQGLLLGYLAALVALGAFVYSAVRPHTDTTALPVQVGFATTAVVAALTIARVSRRALFLLGGRTALAEDVDPRDVVPVDEIGDDVDLRAVLDAARAGKWQPAAALLRATADDDVRFDRTRVLAAQSLQDSQWVEEWFAADPQDALVTTVRAELALHRAWAARGAAYADQTEAAALRAFGTGLAQAERLAERAVELAPSDPTPWATLLEMTRGQQVPVEEFQRRLDGLFERAPHHVAGSHAALQTVCEKWLGDNEQMFDLARGLAAEAPAGSAVHLLPVMAHVERHLELSDGRGGPTAAARHAESGATRTELRTCIQHWLAGPDGMPSPGGRHFGHNLAAYACWLAEDPEAARPHLLQIGRSVTEMPWAYSGEPGEVLAVVRRWAGLPVVAPTGRSPEMEPLNPA